MYYEDDGLTKAVKIGGRISECHCKGQDKHCINCEGGGYVSEPVAYLAVRPGHPMYPKDEETTNE